MQHLIEKYAFGHLTTAPQFEFNSQINFWQEEISWGGGGWNRSREREEEKEVDS